MSQVQNHGTQAPRKRGATLWLVIGLVVLAAALYGAIWFAAKSSQGGGLKDLAKGEMSKLVVAEKTTAPPPITAQDADGKTVNLADLKGQVVVVNLWATWCAPCVKEMPTLARLQGAYANQAVKVLPISLDKGPEDIAKARAFIADKAPLKFYHGDYDLAFSLNPPAEGLPTTLIFDRNGHEKARLSGGADWSTPEAKAVLDRLLSQKG